MVQDIRRITLSGDELNAALASYQRMTPEFLPNCKIISCRPLGDSKIQLIIEKPGEKAPERVNITLQPGDVLKPLIRFCIENNIMLPRNGQKSVLIAENKIALYVVLNLDIDLAGTGEPMQITHLNSLSPADLLPQTVRMIR